MYKSIATTIVTTPYASSLRHPDVFNMMLRKVAGPDKLLLIGYRLKELYLPDITFEKLATLLRMLDTYNQGSKHAAPIDNCKFLWYYTTFEKMAYAHLNEYCGIPLLTELKPDLSQEIHNLFVARLHILAGGEIPTTMKLVELSINTEVINAAYEDLPKINSVIDVVKSMLLYGTTKEAVGIGFKLTPNFCTVTYRAAKNLFKLKTVHDIKLHQIPMANLNRFIESLVHEPIDQSLSILFALGDHVLADWLRQMGLNIKLSVVLTEWFKTMVGSETYYDLSRETFQAAARNCMPQGKGKKETVALAKA